MRQACQFFDLYSDIGCPDPATHKMTYVGYAPYTSICAQWYCRKHYEVMASVVREKADDDDPKERQRAERFMELNNWFQHE
jgi:hypothetical protein